MRSGCVNIHLKGNTRDSGDGNGGVFVLFLYLHCRFLFDVKGRRMDEWHAGMEIRKEGRGDGGAHSFRWRWEIVGDGSKGLLKKQKKKRGEGSTNSDEDMGDGE